MSLKSAVTMTFALGLASIAAGGCSSEDSKPADSTTSSTGGSSSSGSTSGSTSSSSGSTSGSTSSSSGTSGDAGNDSGQDSGSLCVPPLANTATEFNETFTASAMPAMGTAAGGTLETGIYHQTSHTNHEKASGTGKLQGVFAFDATAKTFRIASTDDGVVKPTSGGTYSIAGNKLTLNFTCPATASATFDFTYAAPTFTLYNYPAKHVVVAVKQ